MLFTSTSFAVFFAFYFGLHLILNQKQRVWLVIIGSTIFYAYANVWFAVGLTLFLWGVFSIGLWLDDRDHSRLKKRLLPVVLVFVLLPLAYFKYAGFFAHEIYPLLGLPQPKMAAKYLPIGISFVTFTFISYLVDIYKRKLPAEKKLSYFWASVVFFPHLIAGPIIRPIPLVIQFKRPTWSPRYNALLFGFVIFTVGIVKKMFFADQFGMFVNQIYLKIHQANDFSNWDYLLAVYGFSLQIYCDFSGYTDMALGLARILGIQLPNNFARPYLATSISDFWRRWHITLSNWLRDYIYIPLDGNRRGQFIAFRNVMITMAIGGLWHGANWTFVIWGVMHGLGIGVNNIWRFLHRTYSKEVPKAQNFAKLIYKFFGTLLTFHFVTLLWVFFRAPDVASACLILKRAFLSLDGSLLFPFLEKNMFLLILFGLFFMFHKWDSHAHIRLFLRRSPKLLTCGLIVFAWVLSLVLSAGSTAEFIYFDF